jgi:cyclic-di-GMP-binding protein
MGMPTDQETSAELTQTIRDWLAQPPAIDLAEEAYNLGLNLDALYGPTIQSSQFQTFIEQFHDRVVGLGTEHRRGLRNQVLPLAPSLLALTRTIGNCLKRVALGFDRVLTDADVRAAPSRRHLTENAAAHALQLLGDYCLTLSQANIEVEPDVWRIAYRLYETSRRERGLQESGGNLAESALSAYKRLLAIASLEPLGLNPAELEWAADYATRNSSQLQIQIQRPTSIPTTAEGSPQPRGDGQNPVSLKNDTWYWLDPNSTADPQACIRRPPPEGRSLLFFSTASLAQRANALLARHGTQTTAGELSPDPAFPNVHPRLLLERLRQGWSAPLQIRPVRHRQDYSVEACVGLPNIWAVLHSKDSDPHSLISRWVVTDESPGGYAIMQLLGRCSGLFAGMAVALRRNSHDPWNLCVVRWIRNDTAENIEIGLQMVSSGAIPVRVGFRGGPPNQGMVYGLVLPVSPALRQHQAIMAPAGTYVSRRFTLVSDVEHLYVAQCRLLTLDLQTSNIELFQFEIDPYPT